MQTFHWRIINFAAKQKIPRAGRLTTNGGVNLLNLLSLVRNGSRRAELQSIRKVFAGPRVFRTDRAEHSFMWTAPEAAQFLIDLEETAGERLPVAETERHYLGVVSVSPDLITNDLQILDGLQRLTLTAMFLAFARDRLPGRTERWRIDKMLFRSRWDGERTPRVRLYDTEHDWFALYILDQGATLQLPTSAHSPGERRLLGTARFLFNAFKDYKPAQIRRLVRCITRETALVLAMSPAEAWSAVPALPPPMDMRRPDPAPVSGWPDRHLGWRPAGGSSNNDEAVRPPSASLH